MVETCEYGNDRAMNAEWIKAQLAAQPEKSQAGLARFLGLDPTKVSKILAGKRQIKASELSRIEAYFSSSAQQVNVPQKAEANVGTSFEVEGIEFAKIPVFDALFSAGHGAINHSETPASFYSMSMEMLRGFSNAPVSYLLFVKAVGDSMEPLLSSGDWVLVDTRATQLSTPAIYCFVNGDDAVIKHASQNLETGVVTLIPHNSIYKSETVSNPDKLRVVGRVVFSIRRH